MRSHTLLWVFMALQVHLLLEQPLSSHSPCWKNGGVGPGTCPMGELRKILPWGFGQWPPCGIMQHVPLSPVVPAPRGEKLAQVCVQVVGSTLPSRGVSFSQKPAVPGHPLLGNDPGSPAISVHRHFHQPLSSRSEQLWKTVGIG